MNSIFRKALSCPIIWINRLGTCEASRTGQLAAIEYFQQRKTDIFVKDRKGSNIVHIASVNGHLNILQYVNEYYYYDMNYATSNGKPPLYLASEYNNLDVVKYLESP